MTSILLVIALSTAVIQLSFRLIKVEKNFKDLTKFMGLEQLFEDEEE